MCFILYPEILFNLMEESKINKLYFTNDLIRNDRYNDNW